MPTHFISGKKGGGKSLYALQILVDVLVNDNRSVCTNLVLRWQHLDEYIRRNHPKAEVDLRRRIRILSRDECYHYWRHRYFNGHKVDLQAVTKTNDVDGRLVEQVILPAPLDQGVVYLIDEVQEFFGSYDDWRAVGREAVFYSRQERKLGDDSYFTTPSVDDVVKSFRRIGQDFSYMRNYGKEQFSWFRAPSVFERSVYQKPVVGQNDQASMVRYFRLDPDLANCYDTNAGVGVRGSIGDIGRKPKALPWQMAVGALVLLGCIAWKGSDWGASTFLNKFLGGGTHAAQTAATTPKVQRRITPSPIESPITKPAFVTRVLPSADETLQAFWQIDSEFYFQLPDGRTVKNPDGANWDGQTLTWQGRRYVLRGRASATMAGNLSNQLRKGVTQ